MLSGTVRSYCLRTILQMSHSMAVQPLDRSALLNRPQPEKTSTASQQGLAGWRSRGRRVCFIEAEGSISGAVVLLTLRFLRCCCCL